MEENELKDTKNKGKMDIVTIILAICTITVTVIAGIIGDLFGNMSMWWKVVFVVWIVAWAVVLIIEILRWLTYEKYRNKLRTLLMFFLVSTLVFIGVAVLCNDKDEKQTSEEISPTMTVVPSATPQELTLPPTISPTPTPEPTETTAPTSTNTPTPTNTPEATPTNTPIPTPTNTPVPTPTNTPKPTNTPRPTNTPTPKPTNTPILTSTPTPVPEYKVTFDSNGGSIVTSQIVTYGDVLQDFPEPIKDYYRFVGWTYNGQKVTSINVEHNMVLVASWEPKQESDWVQASYMPNGVHIIETKWTYSKTETTESAEPFLNGWLSNGYRTEIVTEGTFEYADFPETFDKSSSIYREMYHSQSGPTLADGVTREIVSDDWTGYVYWHFAFPLADPCDAGNRTVGPAYNTKFTAGYTTIFNAFKSGKNYTTKTNNSGGGGTVYKITDTHTSYEESGGSYWWFRFEYRTCNYIDTRKVYKYYKTTQLESAVEVFPNDEISNVTKWVKYIEK